MNSNTGTGPQAVFEILFSTDSSYIQGQMSPAGSTTSLPAPSGATKALGTSYGESIFYPGLIVELEGSMDGNDFAITSDQELQADDAKIVAAIQPTLGGLRLKYGPELVTLAKISPATLAALTTNPTNTAAQLQALSEISGLSPTRVSAALMHGAGGPDAAAVAAAEHALAAIGTIPPSVLAQLVQLAH